MISKHLRFSIWIIIGLGLAFFGLEGLGTIQVASSAPGTPSFISTIHVPELPDVAATQTPNPETKIYVVEQGDTLWSIAVKFYGNGAKYTLIQRANDLPDTARLHTGQTLSIPTAETDQTLPPRTPTLVATTPSSVPSQLFPTPTVSPSAAAPSQPTETSTPMAAPPAAASHPDTGPAPVILIVGAVINVLGVVCLLGSIICAMLSYDIYRRSRHYARRRYIGNRVRAGL